MKRFKSEDAWLINPDRPGRSTRKKHLKRGATMARRRRKARSVSKKKFVRRRRRIVSVNPPRRRHRRAHHKSRRRSSRRYHHNPGFLPGKQSLFDAVYVTGGFIGTKVAANMLLPMVGMADSPLVRIGVKGVLAGLLGWGGSKVLGKGAGNYLMIGGLVEAVNDAVQTYVTPFVPGLSMSSYPSLSAYPSLGAYPELSGMVYPDPDETMETV